MLVERPSVRQWARGPHGRPHRRARIIAAVHSRRNRNETSTPSISEMGGRCSRRLAGRLPDRKRTILSGAACSDDHRLSAGGSADITARLTGQWLSERLGQPLLIVNRPGAGTNIATEAVVRAPADGYTLLLVAPANAINATLYDKLNFNFLQDIVPVAGIIRFPKRGGGEPVAAHPRRSPN